MTPRSAARRRARGTAGRGPAAPSRRRPTSRSGRQRRPVGRRRVRHRHLELGPQPGQRALQLVRRVGGEGALPAAGGFEPVQHRVHRAGQLGDLVPAGRLGHPAGQVRRPRSSATSARIASTGRSARPTTVPGQQRRAARSSAARRPAAGRAGWRPCPTPTRGWWRRRRSPAPSPDPARAPPRRGSPPGPRRRGRR